MMPTIPVPDVTITVRPVDLETTKTVDLVTMVTTSIKELVETHVQMDITVLTLNNFVSYVTEIV
jgi:hypothetical protein